MNKNSKHDENYTEFKKWMQENHIESDTVIDFTILWQCWKAAQKAGIVFALMTIGEIYDKTVS